MADDQTPTTNMASPAVEAPVSAPVAVTEVAASPAPNSADSTTTAPAVLTEAAAIPESAKVETSVIENPLGDTQTEVKKTDEKPVEKVAELKTPELAKVELPVYEAFKTPENVKLEGDTLNEFTKILGELETGKLDHKGYQEYGQKLIDFGTKAVADSITRLNDSYVQIHQQAQKARFEALKSDPELGGEKLPETISALQRSIGEYAGTEQQVADFRKEVTDAGLGASPAICRLIYNMQQKINKYTTENDGPKQLPGQKPAPSKVKDYQKFYTA